ncbi:hypothetical protein GCM10010406_29710 [Streptomyces thermolineatus]|uniref:Proteinase inhibitor I42 chagasin domain-containing protein n=1 Tax=Streptomyces thermolineatus TaxID=44033 RepID=A0ABN3LWJ8_9ACTN
MSLPDSRGGTRSPLAVAVLTLLLTVSCSGGPDRGEVFSSDRTSVGVGVEAGERFSLAVRENASIGDRWNVHTPKPDPAVVEAAGRSYNSDSEEPVPGSGGTRYFTFRAVGPGSTQIVLRNCPRGLCGATEAPAGPKKAVVTATYEVTVR